MTSTQQTTKKYTTRYEQLLGAKKELLSSRNGDLPRMQTSLTTINSYLNGGWLFRSTITIASKSGGGKTTLKDQLIRDANNKKINPMHIVTIDFSFEMPAVDIGLRDISAITQTSQTVLLKEGEPLPKSFENAIDSYIESTKDMPVFVIEEACTVLEMEAIIEEIVIEQRKTNPESLFLITIDHSILIKKLPGDNQFDTLHKLGEMATKIRKKHPVIIVILSQMNRTIEDVTRTKPGTSGNYPQTSDIYGSDALLHHTDYLIIIDNPSAREIFEYGPTRIQVATASNPKAYTMFHFLKSRRGSLKRFQFHANFTNFEFQEYGVPYKVGGDSIGQYLEVIHTKPVSEKNLNENDVDVTKNFKPPFEIK